MRMRAEAIWATTAGFAATGVAAYLLSFGMRLPMTWLPVGIATAVLVRFGVGQWPYLAVGSILAAFAFGEPGFSVLLGVPSMLLGPVLLAWYLERSEFRRDFSRSIDVVRFALSMPLAMLLPPTLTYLNLAFVMKNVWPNPTSSDWLRWWLTATIGAMLIVPLAASVSWNTLQTLRRKPLVSAGIALLVLYVTLHLLIYPGSVYGIVLGPVGIVLVMLAAVLLDLTTAALVACWITLLLSQTSDPIVATSAPPVLGLARAWPFGMALGLITLCVQALRGERQSALDALRAAEQGYRLGLLEAAQHEQARLAREMHDAMGQELTGLAMMARGLEVKLRGQEPALAEAAREIVAVCGRTQRTASDIAHGMLPLDAHQGELLGALRELVGRLKRSAQNHGGAPEIRTNFRLTDPLPRAVAESLFRITQEALNNALKHSAARIILLELVSQPGSVQLRVKDDGNGGLGAQKSVGTGLGLRIMQYRAELVGGQLTRSAVPGRGTEVSCTIPLPSEPA